MPAFTAVPHILADQEQFLSQLRERLTAAKAAIANSDNKITNAKTEDESLDAFKERNYWENHAQMLKGFIATVDDQIEWTLRR
jgi:hypothetical protein